MTATATRATTFKMTVNIPVEMKLERVYVFPNDPSKDPAGKGYGANLALFGKIAGEDVAVYPKGFLNKNIEKLVGTGVVADGHYPHDPAERYSIPVKQGDITIVTSQPAGVKYPAFEIVNVGGKAPEPAQAFPRTGAVQPHPIAAKSNEKKPVSIGHPGFLDGAEAEDRAELDAKIAPDVLDALKVKLAVYQALTEFVLRDIAPIYEKHKVGMSPESSAACVQTLFINATGK